MAGFLYPKDSLFTKIRSIKNQQSHGLQNFFMTKGLKITTLMEKVKAYKK